MQIRGITRRPVESHAVFGGLWTLLLVVAGLVYKGTLLTPGIWAGIVPIAAGVVLFLIRRKEPAGWLALVAGESLGVVLGSTLLTGPGSPLMLLLLWPLTWAALVLPSQAGLAVVGWTGMIYLGIGLWYAFAVGEKGPALLSILLYLGTFAGAFFLLRLQKGARESDQAGVVDKQMVMVEEQLPLIEAPTPGKELPVAGVELAVMEEEPAKPEENSVLTEEKLTKAEEEPVTTETATLLAPPAPPQPASLPREDPLFQDLRVARDIQVSLLLASSPRLPGWEASTSFLPARELGGDLYDFIELDPAHRGIMIGDVTGKGIPAALHMAVTRTLFRVEAGQHPNPAEALSQINRSMIEQIPQGCVTMLYGHLNIEDGSLCLANAGHTYPLLIGRSVRELVLDGLPLGIDGEYAYQEIDAHLEPGEALIFYTDGVVEAVNAQGEYFGFDRLQELLKNGPTRRPRTLTRQIVRAVRSFTGGAPQNDDITLLVLRRRYQDSVSEMVEVANDVLGPEEAEEIRTELEKMNLSPDLPPEAWRAAILTLGGGVRDRRGQGPSRELMQQLFLTVESLTGS